MADRIRAVISAAVVGASVVVLAASGSSSKSGDSKSSSGSHPAEDDVKVSACAVSDNQFLGPSAKLSVTNNSSKPSNYLVSVAFESADGKTQLDTAGATVQNLAPGQTAATDATSLKRELRSSTNFNCKVSKVTRLAAG